MMSEDEKELTMQGESGGWLVFSSYDDIKKESTDFVNGKDRSSLGSFAMSDEALILGIMLVRFAQFRKRATDDYYEEISRLSSQLNEDIYYVSDNHIERATGEAMFWGFDNPSENTDNWAWREVLKIVSEHPVAYHDYFRQDIWDTKAIAGFIANDVDADIAAKVVS